MAFPISVQFSFIAGNGIGKYMGVTANEFFTDGRNHVTELKSALLLGHLGIEHHLKQQIAEFALKRLQVGVVNGLGNLIGLFNRVRRYRGKGLLNIPGAARFWVSQRAHNLEQVFYIITHNINYLGDFC